MKDVGWKGKRIENHKIRMKKNDCKLLGVFDKQRF
jgi:hypothetical protein